MATEQLETAARIFRAEAQDGYRDRVVIGGLSRYAANLKQALEGIHVEGLPDSWWYHGPRLAFQPVLIWAAPYASGLLDWPLRKSA